MNYVSLVSLVVYVLNVFSSGCWGYSLGLFFSQQHKLMGSSASAQTSSGVHWYRRRLRFNEVPETVPKVPEKV